MMVVELLQLRQEYIILLSLVKLRYNVIDLSLINIIEYKLHC
jgi:hypothetical protein